MSKRSRAVVFIIIFSAILIWLLVRGDRENMATFLSAPTATETPEFPPLILEIKSLADGYPATSDTTPVLTYTGFHLQYNEEFEQAAWVAYILTKEMVLAGTEARTENFRADTMIITGSATPRDYLRSGYDRGHLAPAGDMKWSEEAMSQSFLMSNMSPQLPGFNRGVWNRLEAKVRNWAVGNDSILVITGPVFYEVTEFIGENKVGIPRYYFKVIADISAPTYKAIAFLIENQSSTASLSSFTVTIDSLEKLTGYDFFSTHTDRDMIERMESIVDIRGWEW
jgi:endonuclease G, mitochondrial